MRKSVSYPDNLIADLFELTAEQMSEITDMTRQLVEKRLVDECVTDDMRKLITDRYREGITLRDIAEAQHTSASVAKKRIIRALDAVRTAGEDYKHQNDRLQAEVNELPIKFAFSNKQFNDMMWEWGLDPEEDLSQICRFSEIGGFAKKTDLPVIRETLKRQHLELQLALHCERFLRDALRYELFNHEYGITLDAHPALGSLGLSLDYFACNARRAQLFNSVTSYVTRHTK